MRDAKRSFSWVRPIVSFVGRRRFCGSLRAPVTDEEKKEPWSFWKSHHAIGASIGVVYVAWLLATSRELGFPRDEGFYFHAAGDYARLQELKRAYDPENVFGAGHNITPAARERLAA